MKPCASLHLSSYNIVSSNGRSLTFPNIDFKNLMDYQYNKYKTFKLVLNSFYNFSSVAFPATQRIINIQVSGLDFFQCYDYSNGQRKIANFGTFMCDRSSASAITLTSAIQGVMFNKPQSGKVDITVTLYDALTNTSTTANYGSLLFCFSIYGIEKE